MILLCLATLWLRVTDLASTLLLVTFSVFASSDFVLVHYYLPTTGRSHCCSTSTSWSVPAPWCCWSSSVRPHRCEHHSILLLPNIAFVFSFLSPQFENQLFLSFKSHCCAAFCIQILTLSVFSALDVTVSCWNCCFVLRCVWRSAPISSWHWSKPTATKMTLTTTRTSARRVWLMQWWVSSIKVVLVIF